jgi:hypothetical protein
MLEALPEGKLCLCFDPAKNVKFIVKVGVGQAIQEFSGSGLGVSTRRCKLP